MDTANNPYEVHQCSKCPMDTVYYCVSCPCDLCPQCKENHLKDDLKTMDHNVVSFRDKVNYIPTQEICVRHPGNSYIKFCEPCQVPVCDVCSEDQSHTFRNFPFGQGYHNILDIQQAYEKKRHQHSETIQTIRSEALFYRPLLLPRIKSDFKTCHTEFSLYPSDILTKAQKLKNFINYVLYDLLNNVFCNFDFKHRCLEQKIEMNRHIVSLQRYEHRYERLSFSRLQFLSTIKEAILQINLTLHTIHTIHTSQLSMTESLKKEDVMESLTAIKIPDRGNRRVGNQCLLKLTSGVEFHQSLTATGVDRCYHISCVTSHRVWVSDRNNLILTDTAGVPLYRMEDLCEDLYGMHTVNKERELIYIDRNNNINKLSKDMKTATTLVKITDSTWWPRCVHWSPTTGDLLVGMYKYGTGMVTRYNMNGQLTQTIQHKNKKRELYRKPNYITENSNADVVVSDFDFNFKSGAVVVTERGGRHRFSYKGSSPGSVFRPRGICADSLSHILVCDGETKTVQMLNKDGKFLSHLLTLQEIQEPYCLSCDVNTRCLWVGSLNNNKVYFYRYITKQDPLTAQSQVIYLRSGMPTVGTEKPRQENQYLLKLISSPKFNQPLTVTGVGRCYHISCVTSNRVWVSDKNNFILTDATGAPLHRVEDFCIRSGLYKKLFSGLHTVNSECELIYIDRNYNIKKLSKDIKTTTTFIDLTNSFWIPLCVYCSPFTGNLLVGMFSIEPSTCMVSRYNKSGKLIQTIQHDTIGPQLFHGPNYITENNNGDVVVSGIFAVVVIERGGRQRFSYTGPPLKPILRSYGICTDELSHILVCDGITDTVQMLNKDGQFLSYLLTKSQGIGRPHSLSYDVNTHRLWVGSFDNNMVCVYRYIIRQDALTGRN